ncbi:OrP5 [Eciton burchellii]|nr:OrP5 [Eciton burchellii]
MASERWKSDIAYAMNPFKFLMWPLGIWPLQVYNMFSLIRYIWSIFCMSILLILPSVEIYMGCTDKSVNIECLMLVSCATVGMLKTISFRIYANNLICNYGSALNDYVTIENGNQRAIMRKHAFMGRFLCCFLMLSNFICCISVAMIPPVADDDHIYINITNENSASDYLIPSKCALEYFNLPYSIVCFVQVIALYLTGVANIGNDTMFLNIILHACGQVKILRISFMDIDATSSKIGDHFDMLTQRHIHLMQIVNKLVKTVSFVLLMQLFISSVLLCIIGFQFILSLKVNDIYMCIKSIVILSTFTIQLMLYSLVGDYLKFQMEKVGLCLYQSAWYSFPMKLMKNVIFILMQTQSPVVLQAGHFIVINLPTFMSILRTSVSYLSVLRVMIDT